MFNRKPKSKRPRETFNFWLPASDLLSSLIFLFLLLLTLLALEFKKKEKNLTSQIHSLSAPELILKKVLMDVQSMLKTKGIDVEVLPKEGILRLSETTLSFEEAQAYPSAQKMRNLSLIAQVFNKVLPCISDVHPPRVGSDKDPIFRNDICGEEKIDFEYECPSIRKQKIHVNTILIEGHTDDLPVRAEAGFRDNLALSAARATSVLRLLRRCEEKISYLHNRKGEPLLAASGYSSMRPLLASKPHDPKNRRIDLRFIMDVSPD